MDSTSLIIIGRWSMTGAIRVLAKREGRVVRVSIQ